MKNMIKLLQTNLFKKLSCTMHGSTTNCTLNTEPKPPCPSLLVGEKFSVAATMQLRSKIGKSGCVLPSSSSCPSKEPLVLARFND